MADAPAPAQKGPQKRARVQSPAKRKEGTKETSSSSSAASPTGAASPSSAPKKFPARMMICWLLFGCRLVCQANRILLGALLPAIRQELTLSDAEAGSLLSAFASGYMFTQILGGALADLLGGKWILQLAITAVSLGSLVAPVALQQGLWPAYCTYFFMGIFEGPSFPTAGSMLSKWIPARERSLASSLADTGGSIGGLLALAAGPVVASHLGWKACFVIFGMLSITFCSAWLCLASSSPAQSSWVSKQELKMLIDEGVVEKATKQRPSPVAPGTFPAVPWRIFISPPVLAVCYAHSVFNFGRYFLYGWIPTFYSQVLDVPATTAAACMTCLQVADAYVKLIVAPFADNLVNSGRTVLLFLHSVASPCDSSTYGGEERFLLSCGWLQNQLFGHQQETHWNHLGRWQHHGHVCQHTVAHACWNSDSGKWLERDVPPMLRCEFVWCCGLWSIFLGHKLGSQGTSGVGVGSRTLRTECDAVRPAR